MNLTDQTCLSPKDIRALAHFRYHIRRFLHFSEETARTEGLEPQQHQMMLAIHACPAIEGPSIGQLADLMFVRPHSAVGLIDRLEHRQLVERAHGHRDRREVRIRLTQLGEEVLKRLSSAHHAELKTSGPDLVEALAAILHEEA